MSEFLFGPTCNSCGMTLTNPTDFGTTASGAKQLDYCRFCYEKGQFAEPDITLEQMAEKIAAQAVKKKRKKGAPPPSSEAAREMAMKMLPMLKRWKKEVKH